MDEPNHIGFEISSLDKMIRRSLMNCSARRELESLTGTNGWIIGYLAHNRDRDICQRDIEAAFSVRRSSVSKVITLMEQKGLIERVPVKSDARLKKLVLTPLALGLHESIEAEFDAMDERLTRGFAPEELEQFRAYIEKMKKNLADCTAKGDTYNDKKACKMHP